MVLLVFKFLAGVLGHSAAMITDAVHSLSDFLTDIVVLVFIKISNRHIDHDHGYGYGKYETFTTFCIGLDLPVVGSMIAANGMEKILRVGPAEGLQGKSYAIPTMEGPDNMRAAVDRFVAFAKEHPELTFLVTPIGCGIAGYTSAEVAPLFREAVPLSNICLPNSFWEYLSV